MTRRVVAAGLAGVAASFVGCLPTTYAFGVMPGLVVWVAVAAAVPILMLRLVLQSSPRPRGDGGPPGSIVTPTRPTGTLLRAWAVSLVGSVLALAATAVVVLYRVGESCFQHGGC